MTGLKIQKFFNQDADIYMEIPTKGWVEGVDGPVII